MRRTIILLVLSSITAGIVWWFIARSMEKPAPTDPWIAVPIDAAAVIDVPAPLNAWQRFVSTSQFWSEWSALPGCSAFDLLMRELVEATAADPALAQALSSSHALVTITNDGGRLGLIAAWPVRVDQQALTKLAPALRFAPEQADQLLKGNTVRVERQALPTLYLRHDHGLILLASSEAVLNDVVAHLDQGNTHVDPELVQARVTSGASADIHVYVHVQRAMRTLGNWVGDEALAGGASSEGWIAFDGELRADALLLSGWASGKSMPARSRELASATPAPLFATPYLSPHVSTFQEITTNDLRAWLTAQRGEAPPDSLYDRWGHWCSGTVTRAGLGHAGDSSRVEWLILRATDPVQAIAALEATCNGRCDTARYRSVRTVHLPWEKGPAGLFGEDGSTARGIWWCALNDAIVLSDGPAGMRAAIDAAVDGSSLNGAEGGFFERMAGGAVLTWYGHLARGLDALAPHCTEKGRAVLRDHRGAMAAIGGVLLQWSPAPQGGWFINLSIARNARPVQPGERSSLWVVNIDAPITAGPELVTDHISRTQQVLVQDEKDRIALISCTGKLIWQRQLDGPIMGRVHQVDRFKNGKLQMLFNTATRIHLIDRNGKDVEGFPIALPEKASAPLSVFDYENKKEYRVLVPTTEARLLNYGLDARPVQGWEPPRTPATCEVPVVHLRMRGKDHLVLLDRTGHVTVLDRRGETRFRPALEARDTEHVIGLVPALDPADLAVLWTDAGGNMLSGKLNGNVDTLYTKDGGPVRTIITSAPSRERLPDNVLVIKNAVLYPELKAIGNGDTRSIVSDINLDGNKERVVVSSDGRISAEPLKP